MKKVVFKCRKLTFEEIEKAEEKLRGTGLIKYKVEIISKALKYGFEQLVKKVEEEDEWWIYGTPPELYEEMLDELLRHCEREIYYCGDYARNIKREKVGWDYVFTYELFDNDKVFKAYCTTTISDESKKGGYETRIHTDVQFDLM